MSWISRLASRLLWSGSSICCQSPSTDSRLVYPSAAGTREVGFSPTFSSSFVQWEAMDCCRGICDQPDVSSTRERRGLANDGLEPLSFVVMLLSPRTKQSFHMTPVQPWHPSMENPPSSPDALTPALLPPFFSTQTSLGKRSLPSLTIKSIIFDKNSQSYPQQSLLHRML